jgi:hypothetical protein
VFCFEGLSTDDGGLLERLRGVLHVSLGKSSSGSAGSREEKIVERGSSTAVCGGKLTPYRRVAEKTVDAVCRALGRATRACLTGQVGLDVRLRSRVPIEEGEYKTHLYWQYGSDADWIERRLEQHAEERWRLSEQTPHTLAEVPCLFVLLLFFNLCCSGVICRAVRASSLSLRRAGPSRAARVALHGRQRIEMCGKSG